VPAFVREGQASFFVDSATQPPLPPGDDCNNNGIPDEQEPAGDRDGDGIPDVCDDDPNGDDNPRPPNGNTSCTAADCPIADAGPDQLLTCAANGATTAQLDGSRSSDPNGLTLAFSWAASISLQNPNQPVAAGSFPLGTTPVSLMVSNGTKTSTDAATVTVLDLVPPVLTIPADITANACVGTSLGKAMASDACGGTVTIVNDAPPHFPVGTTAVHWFAIDQFGNVSTRTQQVTANVTAGPTIKVPAAISKTSCSVGSIGTATATDACGATLAVASNAPAIFPLGSTTVTWTTRDQLGRTASATQKVTVTLSNTTPPTLTVPPNVLSTTCEVPAIGLATGTDQCGGAVAITSDAPARFGVGTTVVTWKATDNQGHTTSKTQQIVVSLAPAPAPPFLAAPPDLTVTACSSPPLGKATAFDACGTPLTVTNNAPSKLALGTTVVTWKATDKLGHTTSRTQRVTAELGDDKSCCPSGTHIIVGTSKSDVLNGTSGSDCILGLGGDDVIAGGDGNDFISGGAGNDTINAGNGDDIVFGGDGDDRIDSGSGNDRASGGAGNDTINSGLGSDFVDGGPGTDTCSTAPDGTDTVLACEVKSAPLSLAKP
jgi:Ca2+-binding RTX toxin-like protein